MTTQFINEFQINASTRAQLNKLLQTCFPDTLYKGRSYFKQLPHYRLLLWRNDKLTGQLSIDYRVMNLNNEPVKVFGVEDVFNKTTLQGKRKGTNLIHQL
jgi:hypothetical protein